MEGVLIDRWLPDAESIPVVDDASVSLARQRVRDEAASLGLPLELGAALATVASELGTNQLRHASGGRIGVRAIARAGVPGLEVIGADRGPGIADPRTALAGASRTPGGLGIGLAGVVGLAAEVDVDVRVGEGTCVRARRFAAPVPHVREVGIYGRPFPGERVSGDDADFVRDDAGLLLVLADGLGHGVEAHDAASGAVEATLASRALGPQEILERCHAALARTRGAVVGVAQIATAGDALVGAVAGNVVLCIQRVDGPRLLGGTSLVVGAAGTRARIRAQSEAMRPLDPVVLFSDGIASRAATELDADLLRERPIVVAQALVERFARDRDDVLVLVAR